MLLAWVPAGATDPYVSEAPFAASTATATADKSSGVGLGYGPSDPTTAEALTGREEVQAGDGHRDAGESGAGCCVKKWMSRCSWFQRRLASETRRQHPRSPAHCLLLQESGISPTIPTAWKR